MHDDARIELGHDRIQALDNVLDEVRIDGHTRRRLLQRAAGGFLAAGAIGGFGPLSSALAATRRRNEGESPQVTLNTAATAEAFAVLFLDQVIQRAPGTYSGGHPLIDILKAAGAAEYDHYTALTQTLKATPITTHIWIPDALFANGTPQLFANIEVAETLFINAYLIGITNFAGNGQGDNARYAAEILGTEAEHRVLARAGAMPGTPAHVYNNVGFEQYLLHGLNDIVAGLEGVGIGFGAAGASPGRFYDYDGSRPATFATIDGNAPA